MIARSALIGLAAVLALVACRARPPAPAAAPPSPAGPLRPTGQTDLPDYSGDFGHFAVDEAGGRLFLAGEGGGEILVFDLKTGRLIQTQGGFQAPHSLAYVADSGELAVVTRSRSRRLDSLTLADKPPMALPDGADALAYDPQRKRGFAVTPAAPGAQPGATLLEIDPPSGQILGRTPLDGGRAGGLALDGQGRRVFVSLADRDELEVVDRARHAVVARWKIRRAAEPAAIALDDAGQRLFVATRRPGALLVVDAERGETVQAFQAPADVGEVVWDAAGRRVFVCGGDGRLMVIEQDDPDRYRVQVSIATPPGARTCAYAPRLHRLFLAAPAGDGGRKAGLIWFDLGPRS